MSPTGKNPSNDKYGWLQEGADVEVEWEKEWWQACVKKIRVKHSGGSGALGGRMGGMQKEVQHKCVQESSHLLPRFWLAMWAETTRRMSGFRFRATESGQSDHPATAAGPESPAELQLRTSTSLRWNSSKA
eukprot:751083-Hanusia_phi.AAC.2